MSDYFQYQIYVIALGIGFNISPKAWSIVFFTDQLPSFINSKITYEKIIVMPIDQLGIDDFWHIR